MFMSAINVIFGMWVDFCMFLRAQIKTQTGIIITLSLISCVCARGFIAYAHQNKNRKFSAGISADKQFSIFIE